MSKQKGFAHAFIIIGLVVVIGGALGFIFWQNFLDKPTKAKDTEKKDATSVTKPDSEQHKTTTVTTVHPNDSNGKTTSGLSYKVTLPDGWSVKNVYENDDFVKDDGYGKKYLVSSFITDAGMPLMQNNQVSTGEVIKTLTTGKGTKVYMVKTDTELVLATCMPKGNDCYLNLDGKSLYIHLYQVVSGAQSATQIDFTSSSAQEIISDFQKIAESLDV